LNAIKRIAGDFYAFQQQLAEEEKKQREIEELKAKEEAQPKKKAGRPRKIDLDAEQ